VHGYEIKVLLGAGDGTFDIALNAPSFINTPFGSLSVMSVAAGDLNGDGKGDLVANLAGPANAALAVMLGNGDGTFQPPSYHPAANPVDIVIAELSGDGVPDVAFSDSSTGAVTLLIGVGDGTFTATFAGTTVTLAIKAVAEDLNGDGFADLLFLSQGNGDESPVGVLIARGDGSFKPSVSYPAGRDGLSLVTLDVNQDGVRDLAVAGRESKIVSVLRGAGDGSFLPPENHWAGALIADIVAGDFNGDSAPDLVVTHDFDNVVRVLLNTGGVAVTLESSRNPAITGTSVTFTAQTAPTVNLSAVAGGTITFRTGGTILGTSPVVAGVATFSTATLAIGAHSVVASYSGDGSLNPRDSATLQQVIEPKPLAVTVVAPNGGEKLFANFLTTIRWTATGATSFDVALSRNGGVSYTAIAGCTALPWPATTCAWTPTGPATTSALIRVTARDASGAAVDTSNSSFAISTAVPTLAVTRPAIGASWATGTNQSIAWTHNLGANAFVRIELSRNGSASWETIAPSVQNTTATTGTFPWTVAAPTTADAFVRVTWIDGGVSDITDAPFSIVAPAVTITAPTTAVNWQSGSTHSITFSHNLGAGQPVDIDLSRDGGSTWTLLKTVTTSATSGSFSWTITGPPTSQARIRVRSTTGASAISVIFTITPRVRVTAPNTAVTWGAGSTRKITWSHNLPATETVDIAFSPDNGATWMPVAAGVPATDPAATTTGSYTGPMPATVTAQGLIRVSWSKDATESDTSDVVFSLAPPSVRVGVANANVTWTIGSTRTISWSHNLGQLESVRIDLSRNGGATWTPLSTADVPNSGNTNGTFDWVVTGPATTAGKIRLTWIRNASVQDQNDANIRIQ
jgi:hypothetical protein